MNEATARIRINGLLEKAGWRFFTDGDEPANIRLEQGVAITHAELDAFEKTSKADSRCDWQGVG